MAKSNLRIEARVLRRKGWGIKTIAHKLRVSSSTASLWCRDIELTAQQMNQLARNARDPYYGKRREYLQKIRILQQKKIQQLLSKGKSTVGALTKRELFIAGVALYWAEGFKKDNLMGFSNSDPIMIRFMVRWLKEACNIGVERLRFRIALNEAYKDNVKSIQKYWQTMMRVSDKQFQKPFFQKVKWKKIYANPEEYHGVLRIRVSKSIDLLREMHGQIEGLRNNS